MRRVMIAVVLALAALAVAPAAQAQAGVNVLTWADNSNNEAGFRIYSKTIPTPATAGGVPTACADATPWTKLADTAPNVTTARHEQLPENVTFCYNVTAFNSAGESAPSNVAGRTVPPTIPAKPSGLGVSGPPSGAGPSASGN